MSNDDLKNLRDILKLMAQFRGQAVHPTAEAGEIASHQALNRNVHWRFVTFGFDNAKAAAKLTLNIFDQLIQNPRKEEKYESLRKYCGELQSKLAPLVEAWETKYGNLYEE